MSLLATVLSVVLAVVFTIAGANKFSGSALAAIAPEHLNISEKTYRLAGVLELLGAFGLLVGAIAAPLVGSLAAVCLGLLLLGAVVLHIRAGDPFAVGDGFTKSDATAIEGWAPAAGLVALCWLAAALILI